MFCAQCFSGSQENTGSFRNFIFNVCDVMSPIQLTVDDDAKKFCLVNSVDFCVIDVDGAVMIL